MKYKQGNILEAFEKGEINTILHQTNICCGMKAGIAKQIAKKYPIVEILDRGFRNKDVLGSILLVNVGNGYIGNLYAQINTYYSEIETFEQRCELLASALIEFKDLYYEEGKDFVGVPLVASGLAADPALKKGMTDLEYFKKYIAPIFESEFSNVTVYYL